MTRVTPPCSASLTISSESIPHWPHCQYLRSPYKQHALKGQKLLAQGTALGFLWVANWRPVRGKSFTYRNGVSIFIRCILKLLPLQGALLTDIIPRAMPWAKSFCPFRACWVISIIQEGVLGYFNRTGGRAGLF